ncbi:MAG: thioredoxin [Anaerolineae bacterium]|nr:thioredoxin [Anaerolineae bacterium]
MGQHTFVVNDDSFQDDVLKSSTPVLVDFWAEWCGPCKMIAPYVDEIAKELDGQLRVAKMDVDENPTIPGMYDVQGIPTLILFKDGKPVSRIVGFRPKDKLKDAIVPHIDAVKS